MSARTRWFTTYRVDEPGEAFDTGWSDDAGLLDDLRTGLPARAIVLVDLAAIRTHVAARLAEVGRPARS